MIISVIVRRKARRLTIMHACWWLDLMDWRQKGDYGDMFDFDEDTVMDLLPKVKEFLAVLSGLMGSE